MVRLSVAKLAVVIPSPCPFLGLQSLVKLAQAFCASQILKVCDRIIGAMSGLDSCVDAVNKEIKIGPYLAGL
jgi:hypothetical protein